MSFRFTPFGNPDVPLWKHAVSLALSIAIIFVSHALFPSTNELGQRADAKRIGDLTEISHKVNDFLIRQGRLPVSLDETRVSKRDPRTGEPYVYRLKGERSYVLCADFDRSTGASPQFAAGHFWDHESGRQCTTISPK